jgi:hypothetical protein
MMTTLKEIKMPELFYSKVKKDKLLHIVNRKKEIVEKRNDISPDEEYLQVSCFSLPEGKTFQAHKHVPVERTTHITQESWIVIQGKIKAFLYDTDDSLLKEIILEPGDCSITFHGGHNYLSLEDNTLVYEYKTGPYFGKIVDKVPI